MQVHEPAYNLRYNTHPAKPAHNLRYNTQFGGLSLMHERSQGRSADDSPGCVGDLSERAWLDLKDGVWGAGGGPDGFPT